MYRDDERVAMASHILINAIIQYFHEEMVKPLAIVGVSDVHPRPLADGLQTFQNFDLVFFFSHPSPQGPSDSKSRRGPN